MIDRHIKANKMENIIINLLIELEINFTYRQGVISEIYIYIYMYKIVIRTVKPYLLSRYPLMHYCCYCTIMESFRLPFHLVSISTLSSFSFKGYFSLIATATANLLCSALFFFFFFSLTSSFFFNSFSFFQSTGSTRYHGLGRFLECLCVRVSVCPSDYRSIQA